MKAMIMLLSIFLISSSLAHATEVPDGYALVPIDHLREALWYHDAYYIELELREEAEKVMIELTQIIQSTEQKVRFYRTATFVTVSLFAGSLIAVWGLSR